MTTGLLEPLLQCLFLKEVLGFPFFQMQFWTTGTVTGVQIELDDLPLHLKYVHEQVISMSIQCKEWIFLVRLPTAQIGSVKQSEVRVV